MQKLYTEQERILSVDFFRGFTMFLLVSNFGQLFDPSGNNAVVAFLGRQLDHAEWSGLRFWDLIQPFFMFIVGVSMPFAFTKKWDKGESWNHSFRRALKRSLVLLFLGWLISSTPTYSTFANVLAQLSVTYLAAFLIMRKSLITQLVFSIVLIIFTDVIYQLWPIEGFNHPYTADQNFGSWFDVLLTGGLTEDRWVAFNAIPTTAHTVWGVICGYMLMKDWTSKKKITVLLTAGLAALLIGYTLSIFIPIIKRVCTSSFIFVSGGWSVIALAISYWIIDVKRFVRFGLFFAIVGMNPLFIYLFAHSGGTNMLLNLLNTVTARLFGWTSPHTLLVINVLLIVAMLWYICYFLYKRKIFIRI